MLCFKKNAFCRMAILPTIALAATPTFAVDLSLRRTDQDASSLRLEITSPQVGPINFVAAAGFREFQAINDKGEHDMSSAQEYAIGLCREAPLSNVFTLTGGILFGRTINIHANSLGDLDDTIQRKSLSFVEAQLHFKVKPADQSKWFAEIGLSTRTNLGSRVLFVENSMPIRRTENGPTFGFGYSF